MCRHLNSHNITDVLRQAIELNYVLTIVCPANGREQIDKSCAYVEFIVAELAGFVVPWEHVMEIVPAFAECGYRHR